MDGQFDNKYITHALWLWSDTAWRYWKEWIYPAIESKCNAIESKTGLNWTLPSFISSAEQWFASAILVRTISFIECQSSNNTFMLISRSKYVQIHQQICRYGYYMWYRRKKVQKYEFKLPIIQRTWEQKYLLINVLRPILSFRNDITTNAPVW